MAQDLYSGPLCRLYARQYVSPVQRALGGPVEIVTPGGPTLWQRNPKKAQSDFRKWVRGMGRSVREAGADFSWEESLEGAYRIEQLPHQVMWALLLVASRADRGSDQPLPASIGSAADDPCLRAAVTDESSGFLSVYPPRRMWLPGTFDDLISLEMPHVAVVECASLGRLLRELQELNTRTWGVPFDRRSEFLQAENADSEIEAMAMHAYLLFADLALHSLTRSLPLVLDD